MAIADYKFVFAEGTSTKTERVKNLDKNASSTDINDLADQIKYLGEYDSKVSITKIETIETPVEVL